jgi:spore coat protein U-like protein
LAIGALLAAAAPSICLADATPVGDPQSVTVDVVGTVPGHCGFTTTPSGQTIPGDLSQGGSLTIDFGVNCNAPFLVRASSKNGAFLTDQPAVGDGLANQLDYSLHLTLATDLGALDATCNADALTAGAGGCAFYGTATGQGLSSGDGVAINQSGSLQFGWTQSAKQLVAGSYSDTLTIVVEVRS